MNNTLFLLIGMAHPLSIEIFGGNSGDFLAQVNFFIDQSWVGNKASHLHSVLGWVAANPSLSQLEKFVSLNPKLFI